MLQNAPMYSYIPASDVARARRFYEDKVGLKPKQEIAVGVVYEFGKGTACFLYPTQNAGTAAMKTVNSIFTGGGAKAAWFKDSEGHILAVIQNWGTSPNQFGDGALTPVFPPPLWELGLRPQGS